MKLFSVLWLALILAVYCSSSSGSCKRKGNKSLRSIFNNEEDLDHKKFKRFDDDLIEEIRDAIDCNDYYLFMLYVSGYGPLILSSVETNLLEYIYKNEKIELLKYVLKNSQRLRDSFDVILEMICMAAPERQDIIKLIAKPDIINTDDNEAAILYHFLKMKDEISLKTVLKNGIKFKKWKNHRHSNLAHVAVQKNWTSLIKHLSGFDEKDKSGLTPIFYATTPEMIKFIRFNCKGARDHVNKKGLTVWQKVLKSKNINLLNALISFERRLKKFRNKQMNFYDIPWVKTASILNIDRRFLLWDTFKAVNDWMTNILDSFFLFLSNPLAVESNVLQPIFIKVDDETGLYAPNPIHKPEIFKFAGSIIGLSLAMNIPIKQKFIPAIYCVLMHEEIDLVTDLMEQSPAIFKSMQYLNDPSVKISEMQLNLLSKPSIYVNRRLVPKYIKEYSKDVLIGRYEREIEALVDGFESVLPISIQDYFTLSEFKKILTGKPADYSPDEFINALVCKDLAIKNALRRFIAEITSTQRGRGLLLKFITGLNALPADGFERLERKISVVIDRSLIGKLPTSFTCTFTLKLPPYLDYETFSSALMRAIEWTTATDNEAGLSNEDEGIELGFDSDSEIEDGITTGTMLHESESDISDFYESDYDSSVSEVEDFTTLDIESDFLPDA